MHIYALVTPTMNDRRLFTMGACHEHHYALRPMIGSWTEIARYCAMSTEGFEVTHGGRQGARVPGQLSMLAEMQMGQLVICASQARRKRVRHCQDLSSTPSWHSQMTPVPFGSLSTDYDVFGYCDIDWLVRREGVETATRFFRMTPMREHWA
ncbi:hypothetical protein BD309DRAFT_152947 [Dichomitus squalens]|nr:hypothetical protein BD309DRAFT_152947 [Dichomitus squalens]